MRDMSWPSVEAPDRSAGRSRRANQSGPVQDEADWARQAFDVARIVYYSIDCASGFMLRSRNSADVLGMPSSGPAAAWPDAVVAKDRLQYALARNNLSPRSPRFEAEYRLRNKTTGQHIWVLDRGVAEFDAAGGLTGLRGVIVDISGQNGTGRERRKAARLRSVVAEAARMAPWHFDVQAGRFTCMDEMLSLLGISPHGFDGTLQSFEALIHPEDREAFHKAHVGDGAPENRIEVEFRLLPEGPEPRWLLLRGDIVRRADGVPLEIFGVVSDITERKTWEKRQAMLLRELSHRVKNTLAVVQSLARQTLRSSASTQNFVDSFEGRIRSLGASHSLLTEADWRGATLESVIRHQVAALVEDFEARIRLRGPDVLLSAEAATQLGLVLHELAANAVKFGALSVSEGHVRVDWAVTQKRLRLKWREQGGPRITGEPGAQGFGSLLISSSAIKATRCFRLEGLVCTLDFAV